MHIHKNSAPIRLLHGFTYVEIALKAQITIKRLGEAGYRCPHLLTANFCQTKYSTMYISYVQIFALFLPLNFSEKIHNKLKKCRIFYSFAKNLENVKWYKTHVLFKRDNTKNGMQI